MRRLLSIMLALGLIFTSGGSDTIMGIARGDDMKASAASPSDRKESGIASKKRATPSSEEIKESLENGVA